MKYSHYNSFVYNEIGRCFIINCLHKSIIQIDSRLKSIIEPIIDNIDVLNDIHPDLLACMKDNHMILEDDTINEFDEAIKLRKKWLHQTDILFITINPTLDCNLRCWYCYEKHHIGSLMTTKIQRDIIDFIKVQSEKHKIQKLHIAFFGGEPMLAYRRAIFPLLSDLSLYCKEHKITLHHHYTSNGTLLSPKRVDELLSFSSNLSVQIAFDGNREWHNKTKVFSSGVGSFDITKSNLFYIAQKGITTTVRCNLTKKNINSFKELITELSDILILKNVKLSFQNIWQEGIGTEMMSFLSSLQHSLKATHINSNIHSFRHRQQPCICDYVLSFVLNYNGDIFKCTARDFNNTHKMGHLHHDGNVVFNNSYQKRYLSLNKPICYTCKVLPICPVCSQAMFETITNICPININSKMEEEIITDFFQGFIHNTT